MIYLGSRYETGEVFRASVGSDTTVPPRTVVTHTAPYLEDVTRSYIEYSWVDGDRMDLLAYRSYGNSALWWVIADFNPEILDPSNITPGTVVRVPYGG